ncbi:MAG: hypothetical protein A7315_02255 [Candidatus Altiarchaeales archaeon WOR_SM1_79]|nr:MAG: hypothetical protein A7315_02255 [Candidatus Altiarchaeales archaeon WOR_SM1_79]
MVKIIGDIVEGAQLYADDLKRITRKFVGEKNKEKCLFKLESRDNRKALENNDTALIIPMFRSKGLSVDDDAKVSKVSEDLWKISDQNHTYVVKDTGKHLEIYDDLGSLAEDMKKEKKMVTKEEKYLFKLKYKLEPTLQMYKSKNQNIDSALLKGRFRDNHHPLSKNAKISRISQDTWEITDGNEYYEIRDISRELVVYQITRGYGTKDEEEPDMAVSPETEQLASGGKEIGSWKELCMEKDRELNELKIDKKRLEDEISELGGKTGGVSQEIDKNGLLELIDKVRANNRFLDTYIIEALIERAKEENKAEFTNTLVKVLDEMLDDDEIKERLRQLRSSCGF